MTNGSRHITEAQFQGQVIDYARLRGFKVWHNADSRRTQAGIPDLILIREPLFYWVELKSETGRVRPEQREFIRSLQACGQYAGIYRPSDFPALRALLDVPKERVA